MRWIRKLAVNLFPPPRQRLEWKSVWPLVAFAAVFAGVWGWLDATDRVMFARPAMFWLLAVTPWIWWMQVAGYGGLSRGRSAVALLTRLLLCGLFVMLLAEPRAVRKSDTLSVVYALDISDSVGDDTRDKALEFVAKTVATKPSTDEAGLIVFGRNASVELPPRTGFAVDQGGGGIALNTRIDRDATNLEQALSLSAAMLPEENLGRVVLISDGTSTEGSLSRVLDELKARGIAVDVVSIQYDHNDEVWLERIELPRFVKLGETYEASVVLSSLQAGAGRLLLRENGKIISEEEVEFQSGRNRYVLPIKLREAGYYEYSATIEVPQGKDHIAQNNTVLDYIFVEGEGKVLLVTDPGGEDRDWQSMAKALKEGKRMVDVQSAYDFPRDALALMAYDAIVFVNAPADSFDQVQMKAVRDAVFDLGIGYLMVGGPNSFGPGGYQRTPIEEVLPVTMDVSKKRVLPKAALVIILHTCEFAEGNTWAKRITKQAIKVLSPQDECGVAGYVFPGGDGWIFPLTPASDYEKLVPKIEAAEVGDMPSFGPTMQMGLDALKASDAAAKHMIVISDGDPQPPSPKTLGDFKAEKITISTVSIQPHGGIEIATLQSIANVTGGRYYPTNDPSQLPAIFIKEAKTLRRNMIQNKTVQPQIGFDAPTLKGIDGVPKLHGYVLTSTKEQLVQEVLRVPEGEDQLDPILAIWKYGLGASAAFTSDLSTNWGADWVEWDKYQAFTTQLLTEISRTRREGHLRMSSYTSGNQGVIVVEDYHPEDTFLELKAIVSGPREQSETISLKQTGPRRYQATLPLWGRGRYQILASPVAGGRKDERAFGGFIVPYSPEYLRFRSNPIVLNEIAEKTGGQMLQATATADDIYKTRRQARSSSRPIFDWFLIALACLLPLDVAIRRVQLDWSVIKSMLGLDRRQTQTATMGTLLKKKKEVGATLESQKEERPVERPRPAPVSRPRPPARPQPVSSTSTTGTQPAAPRPQQAPKTTGEGTTMSRLLDAKRKRQQGSDEEPK